MNKGFIFYLKRSFNISVFSLRKAGFVTRVKLFFYSIMSFVGKFLLLTRPIFQLADNNMAEMVDGARNINFEKMFHGITKERYKKLLLADLVIEAKIILIVLFCFLLPLYIRFVSFTYIDNALANIYFSLSIAIGVIAMVLVFINAAPLGFLAHKSIDSDASDFLFNVQRDKKKRFFGTLLTFLFEFVIVGICTGVCVGLYFFALKYNYYEWRFVLVSLLYLIVLVALALGIFVLVPTTLIRKYTLYILFNDTVTTKKVIIVKPQSGLEEGCVPLFNDDEELIQTKMGKEKK